MRPLFTIVLLLASNCFMIAAWYGHLKFKSLPLWLAILASWGLAFFEYVLQVPANRLGYGEFSAFQLKILQEVITLIVFVIFASIFLKETLTLRHAISFALIFAAVVVAFYK
ncbi:MAG: DMT family protein [Bdellovibrionales bacterium]|nr:DMT family protein [Bdellovibrionales bacterium]